MPRKLTQDEVLDKFRAVHGDRYDYSLVEYKNNRSKVKIVCPDHGEFFISPRNHKKGQGCKKCSLVAKSIKLRASTSKIIADFVKAHGDLYDYSLVDHKNHYTKVKIVCREHGVFEQLPGNHAKGQGCPKCLTRKVFDTTSFISESCKVHGDTYCYSKSEYSNYSGKVTITCKIHGDFEQSASDHLSGKGCSGCGSLRTVIARKKKFASFVKEANEIHNGKYTYVEHTYGLVTEPMTIVCPEHGEFEQTPTYHLSGSGCSFCGGSLPLNIDVIKARAFAIYGDLYDYSESRYVNYKTRILIRCKEHGYFWKSPAKHVGSDPQGCPKCSKYGFDAKKPAVFYLYLTDKFLGFGISNDISRRDRDHRKNLTLHNCTVVSTSFYEMSGESAKALESSIKQKFKKEILNTGIPGFILEAVGLASKDRLINYLKENLPEGRSDET